MGFNWEICGFKNIDEFVKAMCLSEVEHLRAMVNFAKGNKLGQALRDKNWKQIAKKYNGPAYKAKKYDTNLKANYELLKKRGGKK
jgi:hypothetical protein